MWMNKLLFVLNASLSWILFVLIGHMCIVFLVLYVAWHIKCSIVSIICFWRLSLYHHKCLIKNVALVLSRNNNNICCFCEMYIKIIFVIWYLLVTCALSSWYCMLHSTSNVLLCQLYVFGDFLFIITSVWLKMLL